VRTAAGEFDHPRADLPVSDVQPEERRFGPLDSPSGSL
jgi:hypothetical protein